MAETQTTNPGAAETVEVDVHGLKLALPPDVAAKLIASRDADKASRREINDRLGRIEAEKQAAEAARLKAEEDKAALEAAKNGEIDKVRELLTADATKKITGLSTKYRDQALRGAVASLPSLLKLPDAAAQKSLIDDVVAQLRHGCQFDLDSDTLQVIGADGRPALGPDGKPMAVDAFIAQHIEARPYLRQPTNTPGSGGAGAGQVKTSRTITRQQYEQAQRDNDAATLKGLAKGEIMMADA